MTATEEMVGRITDFFHGDACKTHAWFQARNPNLGDVSPNYMIAMGRTDRLRKFIYGALPA